MNYKKLIMLAFCASLLLPGCGTKDTSNDAETSEVTSEEASKEASDVQEDAGKGTEAENDEEEITNEQYSYIDTELELQEKFLPDEMTDLTYGGQIPASMLREDLIPACVDPKSLVGTWCVEGSSVETPLPATSSTLEAKFDPTEDKTVTAFTTLPDTMVFGLDSSGSAASSLDELDSFSKYHLVDCSYRDQDGDSLFAILPYEVSGSTLAVGFYNSGDNDNALLRQEIDYKMDWKGWKLTLTYGDESVTYVPLKTITDAETNIVLFGGDIVDGYQGIDGITGVYPGAETPQIVKNKTTAINADFTFNEDGTVKIDADDGTSYEFEFRYSGTTLTLIDGNHAALYAK